METFNTLRVTEPHQVILLDIILARARPHVRRWNVGIDRRRKEEQVRAPIEGTHGTGNSTLYTT